MFRWMGAAGSRLRGPWPLHLAFAFAAAFMLLLAWVLHDAGRRIEEATRWVDHTQAVLHGISLLREDFAQVEAGQRSYLLTGDRAHLATRDRAAEGVMNGIARLSILTADNPLQQHRLVELRARIRARLDTAAKSVVMREQMGFRQAWPSALVASAEALTQQFNELTLEFREHELQLLAQRTAREEARREFLNQALLAAMGGSLLILAPAHGVALHHQRRRRDSEQRLTDIVSTLPVVVWRMRLDARGQRTVAFAGSEQQLRALFGIAQLDVETFFSAIADEDRERVRGALVQAERTGGTFSEQYRMRSRNGLRWIHGIASLRREADGAGVWNGYFHDVTEQMVLQQELTTANETLEAFSYSVSHDLRAPLAAIEGFGQALQERAAPVLDTRSLHFLDRIRAGVKKMNALIEAMLTLASVTRAELEARPVDLLALAQDVVEELRAAEPGREVEVAFTGSMPTFGDDRLLRQVLANLVGNAWKFTRPAPQPRIEIGTLTEDARTVFFVRDNGVGFPMARAAELFGAFRRLHRDSEFPGMGIGLATVQRIVARHGGHVWAQSEPGVGTTMFFTLHDPLPAARARPPASAPAG